MLTPLTGARATVSLDASGNGTASVGPLSAMEIWHPANVSVQVSTNVNEAQCTIYIGDSPIQPNFRDSTFTGSTGDTSDAVSSDVVKCGHFIWAVWTGGDPQAVATLSVSGTREL